MDSASAHTTVYAALFAVFGVLVAWHARVEERMAWHDALHTANLHGAARVNAHEMQSVTRRNRPAPFTLPQCRDLRRKRVAKQCRDLLCVARRKLEPVQKRVAHCFVARTST